jgi:hypothetical protein
MLVLTSIAGALLTLSVNEVELLRAPPPGVSRSMAIEAVIELEGGQLWCSMNGSEVPSEYLPELFLEMTDVRTLELMETFEGGAWLRRYDTVGWENDGSFSMDYTGSEMSYPWSSAIESPIEGRVVRLTPEADGSVAREFADDGEDDADLLAGLQADLRLAALLPDGPVAEGAAWKADGSELGMLFDPCGDLAWDMDPEAAERLMPEIRTREHSGELGITLRELSEDGERAYCRVEGVLTRTTEQPGDLSQVPVVDGTATDTVTETWELEGELVWDLAAHAVLSLELDGELQQDTLTARDPDQPGSTYESLFPLSGNYSLTITCAVVEAD